MAYAAHRPQSISTVFLKVPEHKNKVLATGWWISDKFLRHLRQGLAKVKNLGDAEQ